MTAIKVKEVKNIFEKMQGLIGAHKPYPLLLRTRFGIHTFGMKYPIDIVILDDSFKITTIKQSLQPNQIFFWNPMYKNVLELPKGDIKKYKMKLDQTVHLSSV